MDEKQAPVALTEEELEQITGGVGVNVTGLSISPMIDIGTMDLETALLMVQQQRASGMEAQIKSQIETVTARNATIASLNDDLGTLNQFSTLFANDAKSDDKISTNTVVHVDGKPMSLGDALTSLNNAENSALKIGDIVKDGQVSKAELDQSISSIKSLIDTSSNLQQMDMIRLQSLANKRNEAFEIMTNFVKKMQDSRSSIIGNMR